MLVWVKTISLVWCQWSSTWALLMSCKTKKVWEALIITFFIINNWHFNDLVNIWTAIHKDDSFTQALAFRCSEFGRHHLPDANSFNMTQEGFPYVGQMRRTGMVNLNGIQNSFLSEWHWDFFSVGRVWITTI